MAELSAPKLPPLWRHAWYDLRGGARHFRLFFICLMLGVAVMGCIGSMVSSLKAGINRDAKSLLGGDVEVQQIYQPIPELADSWLIFHSQDLSRSMDMRAMAEANNGRTLIELKGVDAYYPLYGKLELTKKRKGNPFFADHEKGIYGAVVDQSLLDMLHVRPGQPFAVGAAHFVVTAIISSEPDRSINGLTLGPRVLTSMDAVRATQLIGFGSMVHYRTRLRLPEHADLLAWKREFAQTFPDAHWNVHDWRDGAPGLISMIDRLSLFFALTGITTLMVAGIGISNATQVYLWSKRHTIAIFKCLGASTRYVETLYLIQLLAVGLIAIACGLTLAALGEQLLLYWLDDLLPVRGASGIYPLPLVLSACLGVLTVLLFGLFPLRQASAIKPAALFRGYADFSFSLRCLSLPFTLLHLGLIALMIWLAVLFTGMVKIPLYFSVGLAAAMALLYGISALIRRYARRMALRTRRITWSMALSNLARPGAATTSMVIALGIGMCLLVTLALVGSNLRRQVEQGLPEHAPAFFLVDIQPSERDALLARLKALPSVRQINDLPMVRGRIIAINGVPADKADIEESARWAVRSDRGLTWAAQPPAHASLIAGKWWRKDYHGAPLVSFDASLAHGMGLKLGDTITISVMDKEVTATISNLRDIQWGSLEMNFAIILSPGALDGLPATWLATLSVPSKGERAVQSLMAREFPQVSVVRVREVLNKIAAMLNSMSRAVLITSSMTIACGILVMASAVHASLHKRLFDTVMLKVLGVTRGRILRIYLLEFALLSLSVALVAMAIGSLAAYGIMQLMIFSDFELLPSVILATLGASLLLSGLLGLAATALSLRVRPLSLLRNE